MKLRLGMVGGGPGAGISETHRHAIALSGAFEIVAGAFSRTPSKNREMASQLAIDPERTYTDFREMAVTESERHGGIECVTIVAPNSVHAPATLAFLERGIAVICEKPLALSWDEARLIRRAAARADVPFALTHNYSAYPMVLEARERVGRGDIGTVRVVQVEYAQGGRSRLVEAEGDARTSWRMDPEIGGPAAVLGDLGSHAFHLMHRITGLDVTAVSADLATVVAGRNGVDDAIVKLRFSNGARGLFWASMIANGNGQGLRIRVFGERGSIEWYQEDPDRLWLRSEDGPMRVVKRGEPWCGAAAKRATRTRAGQPEGFIEGFANMYVDMAELLRARKESRQADPLAASFATALDGETGMAFIESAVRSSNEGGAWVPLPSATPADPLQ